MHQQCDVTFLEYSTETYISKETEVPLILHKLGLHLDIYFSFESKLDEKY